MKNKQFTMIEEKEFYTVAKDGSEVWLVMDFGSEVSVKYGEADIETVNFENIKLILYPNESIWTELPVKQFEDLNEYIPQSELNKIEQKCSEMLIDHGCELMEFEGGVS